MTKKSVFWVGFAGTLLVMSLLLFDSHVCYVNKFCNKISDFINQDNLTIIFIMPFLLFLSLITYKMHEEVFRAWWNFARWFVPVIILATLLINSQSGGGGMGISGAISGGFDALVIGIFYVIFVITSLVKIAGAYRKNK